MQYHGFTKSAHFGKDYSMTRGHSTHTHPSKLWATKLTAIYSWWMVLKRRWHDIHTQTYKARKLVVYRSAQQPPAILTYGIKSTNAYE